MQNFKVPPNAIPPKHKMEIAILILDENGYTPIYLFSFLRIDLYMCMCKCAMHSYLRVCEYPLSFFFNLVIALNAIKFVEIKSMYLPNVTEFSVDELSMSTVVKHAVSRAKMYSEFQICMGGFVCVYWANGFQLHKIPIDLLKIECEWVCQMSKHISGQLQSAKSQCEMGNRPTCTLAHFLILTGGKL